MEKTSIQFVRRRFSQIVAPVMGWNVGPFFIDGKPQHGNVQLENVFGARYRIVQLCEDSTGERNLSDAYTKSEMLVYLDGILRGSEKKS